jgi:hypothetical protein
MPIVFEAIPEFTPPGAQSPVCARSRHTQRSTKLVMAEPIVCEQTEGEICVGSSCCPRGGRLPIGTDRSGDGHRRSSAIAIAAQASAIAGEATAIEDDVTKNHAARQEENRKIFTAAGIFRNLWTVHRLRSRRTGPIRQLCETR